MKKKFLRYVTMSVAGMLGLSCYILADTFFVSAALGGSGLAALNLAIPVYGAVHGVGLMLGVGGSIRYAFFSGQGKCAACDAVFSGAFVWALLFSLAGVLLGAAGADVITHFVRADEAVYGMTRAYLRLILLCSPLFIVNETLLAFVRSAGAPRLTMLAMLGGSAGNVALDYLFMFPLKMEIFGAALATCLAPAISLMILSSFFFRRCQGLRLIRRVRLQGILAGGVPSLLGEVSAAAVMMLFNMLLMRLHGNIGVAAYGIIANLSLIMLSVYNGIGQGVQPLISHAYGENRLDKVRRLLAWTALLTGICAALMYAGILLGAERVVAVFNREGDAALAALAAQGLRCYFLDGLALGGNVALCACLSAVRRERVAQLLALMHGFVLVIPLALLFAAVWQTRGLWLAFPMAEALTLLAGGWYCARQKRKTADTWPSQSVDKARKRKNSFEERENRRNFCLLRQLHLQMAVTYVCVSSLICKLVSLPCRLSQPLPVC